MDGMDALDAMDAIDDGGALALFDSDLQPVVRPAPGGRVVAAVVGGVAAAGGCAGADGRAAAPGSGAVSYVDPVPSASRTPSRGPAPPVLLAVDGDSLAHRAFHAYGSARVVDRSGRPRGPLYGFLALLTALCDRVAPLGTVVGFDCRIASRRRERCARYKANRVDKDPQLSSLLDELPVRLGQLGVQVVVTEGWEADDVVASAAATAEGAGWRCVVATSDRDAFGLVSDATTVLRLRSGLDNAVEVTPRRLRADVGVAACQYVEFAALRGDTSDNLPGVRGIGPARAASLLSAYPTVASAAADPLGCRSVLGRERGQALLDDLADESASVFHRNVSLMSVRRDLPVDLHATRPRLAPEPIAARLESWGLAALAGRIGATLAVRPEQAPPAGDADVPMWL